MGRRVVYTELVAIKEGEYTNYVFKDLTTSSYIMCTKLPNWKVPDITIGSRGYLSYVEVSAGEKYYDSLTETQRIYNYSNTYFDNFILKQEIVNSELIL